MSWWTRKKRKIKYKIKKKVFGKCRTCGRANSPRHTCRMKFTKTNAQRLRSRG